MSNVKPMFILFLTAWLVFISCFYLCFSFYLLKMEAGFEKGSSNNLPEVSSAMILNYYHNNDNYNSVESKGQKASKAARPSYGDSAVGYVQVSRQHPRCVVKALVTPEHRVLKKGYPVTVEVDEQEQVLLLAECNGCVASSGGCKHAIALVFWLHRRAEEPSVTDTLCYWKKSSLAKVGSTKKFITLEEMCPGSSLGQSDVDSVEILKPYFEKVEDSTLMNTYKLPSAVEQLSLHYLYSIFLETDGAKTANDFAKYCEGRMTNGACVAAERSTTNQSKCKLWFELRYCRISASNIYEATRCNVEGSLVEKIFGAHKTFDTLPMQRGRVLEGQILQILSEETNIKFQKCGLLLDPKLPMLGATPDAVSEEFVVEVKAPSKEKTFENYYKNNVIQKKYLSQIQLQMHFAKKLKGYFVVADPNFEANKKITKLVVGYNKDFCEKMIHDAVLFWNNYIFKNMNL